MILKDNIITGEKIQQLADIYLGFDEDFNYNPIIRNQRDKCVNFNEIKGAYNNPRILFCYSHRLSDFLLVLPHLKNKFILITHNSDANIGPDDLFQSILNHPLLIKWWAQNVCITHEKLEILPIGLANSMWSHGNTAFFDRNTSIQKTEKVYFHFNMHTNYTKRQICYDHLIHKIPFLASTDPISYHETLSKYEFCICPEGNGADTHRFWEALYLKSIPIVVRNDFVDVILEKTKIPMIVLNSWDELVVENLNYSNFILEPAESFFDYYKKKILEFDC